MATSTQTDSGTLFIPGGYGKTTVIATPGGVGTTGVVALVGESTSGPRFSEEESLGLNSFGPDADSDVRAKYGSGPLLDGFLGLSAASADDRIPGQVQRVILIKTNSGSGATATIPAIGSGTYATLTARSTGKSGNLLSRVITATPEVVPTTGSFLLAPPQANTAIALRVNGGAAVTTTVNTGTLPSASTTAIDGLAGVDATGGTNRSLITAVAGTLTMTQDSGFQCHVVISTSWANVPTVGDLAYIPTGSPFAGANEGTYVVTAATTARLDLYKLLDAAGAGSTRTAPTTEAAVTIAAITDLACFAPTVVSLTAAAVSPGLGKSLEFANSGSNSISNNIFVFASASASPPAAAATWVSTSSTPYVLTSGTEYGVSTTISRQSDSTSDTAVVAGQVVMTIGYSGTTASLEIDEDGVFATTVVGGSGTSLTLDLNDYATVADLCTYLGTQTGYTAAAATAAMGQKSPLRLDPGTYGFATSQGAKTGRIKSDGANYRDAVNSASSLAYFAVSTGFVGLPDVASQAFFAGGTVGGSTDADFQAALDALERVRCNFVVTAVSRDASADIDDGLTDSSSTYTIEAVNANLRSHVISMNSFKKRRWRQGFASFRGTFEDAREAASNLATGLVSLCFQDCRTTGGDGRIKQFQPWMMACKAAGMQAGGFYRPIVDKFIDCNGVLQAAGDFDDQSDTHLENALTSGLLFATRDELGGFRWVSDQTTYTRDDNFVYNSVVSVYVMNVLIQGAVVRMQRSFNGTSVADTSAAQVLTVFEAYLADALKLKLISPSDGAPKGFVRARVVLAPPVIRFSARCYLSTGIYFEIVDLEIAPVSQTAGG